MAISDADTARLKAEFLALIESDHSEVKARKKLGISAYYLKIWRETDADFRAASDAAKEDAIERAFDRLDEALELYPNPQQAKVFSDNVKWKLAKLRPERFGDALNLKTTHTIDLTERMARAIDRLAAHRLRPLGDPVVSADTLTLADTAFRRLPAGDSETQGKAETRPDTPRGVAGVAPQAHTRDEHATSPPPTPARSES